MAEVGIGPNAEGGFALTVELAATLDLPHKESLELVRTAHKACSDSTTRGKFGVFVSVNDNDLALFTAYAFMPSSRCEITSNSMIAP